VNKSLPVIKRCFKPVDDPSTVLEQAPQGILPIKEGVVGTTSQVDHHSNFSGTDALKELRWQDSMSLPRQLVPRHQLT
jgi:hypothetical protein